MKTSALLIAGAAVWLAAGGPSLAEQYVYPAKGQSASKQAKDESECGSWASHKTGFDPSMAPPAQVEAETKVTGSGARVIGAGGGAAIAAIAGGNPATGALVGAVGGGVTKRIMNKNAAKSQNQANAGQYEATRAAYLNARGACLSGRGYSVK